MASTRRAVSVAAVVALTACTSGGQPDAAPTSIRSPRSSADEGADVAVALPDTGDTLALAPVSVSAAEPSRCAGDAAPAPPASPIRVWHSLTGAGQQAIEELVDELETSDPSFDVDLVTVEGGYDALMQRLADTPPVEQPDVVMGGNTTVRLQADSGRFVPVVDCTDGTVPASLGDLLPVISTTYTVDGALWAAPFNVSAPVLVYDAARWRRAGLDPDDPPADHDELEAAVRQLRDSGEATTGIVLYDRSAGWLITVTAAQRDVLLARPDNGHGTRGPIEVDLTDPAIVEVLERFRQLRAEGYVTWLGWDVGREGADDLLQLINPIEPSGMTLHTSAALGALIALKETEGGVFANVEIGVAPLPGPAVSSLVGGGAWWLVDTDDPERVAAAWRAVERLVDPDTIARFAATTGYVPTTERAAASPVTTRRWEQYPFLRIAYDQLAEASGAPVDAGLQVGPGPQVDREIELAAAFTIDAGNDATAELRLHGGNIADLVDAYRSTVTPG